MLRFEWSLLGVTALTYLVAAGGCTVRAPETSHAAAADAAGTEVATLSLRSLDGLEVKGIQEDGVDPVKAQVDVTTYRSRRALRVTNDAGLTATGGSAGGQVLVMVKGSDFEDGILEADVVGVPRPGAPPSNRGFVGIAFHVQDNGARYESFYIRAKNGRAEDQLQRNHSVQYVEQPDFPWQRLRQDSPGVYESYVDLRLGEWTKLKIVIAGVKARLYVNGSEQPCLVINDLKLAGAHGQIALWTGSNTEAYFSNLVISRQDTRNDPGMAEVHR